MKNIRAGKQTERNGYIKEEKQKNSTKIENYSRNRGKKKHKPTTPSRAK
jgi:hypothetical protein